MMKCWGRKQLLAVGGKKKEKKKQVENLKKRNLQLGFTFFYFGALIIFC
jgi:hypothetical protein